jgi:putative sterol carrier protein
MTETPTARKLILEEMPKALDVAAADGIDAVVQFRLGKNDNYFAVIKDKTCTTQAGVHSRPDVTLTMDAKDYVSMVLGDTGLLANKLKVSGNIPLAIRMNDLFK